MNGVKIEREGAPSSDDLPSELGPVQKKAKVEPADVVEQQSVFSSPDLVGKPGRQSYFVSNQGSWVFAAVFPGISIPSSGGYTGSSGYHLPLDLVCVCVLASAHTSAHRL